SSMTQPIAKQARIIANRPLRPLAAAGVVRLAPAATIRPPYPAAERASSLVSKSSVSRATPRAPGIHFSEAAGLRHLHVGGSAIQSAMRLDAPDDLALAYTRAMMAGLLFCPEPRDVTL